MACSRKRLEVLSSILSNYFATAIINEAIGHDPVKTGDECHLSDYARNKIVDALLSLKALEGIMRR